MRKIESQDKIQDQVDHESSDVVTQQSSDNSMSALDIETQAQSSSPGKGSYQKVITIGALSLVAIFLIAMGVSSLNSGSQTENKVVQEMNQMSQAVQPLRLNEAEECSERQLVLPDGSCKTCEQFTKPNDDGTECIQPECPEEQVVFIDGSCMKCFPYTQPGPGRRGCDYPKCGPRQQIGFNGFCKDCPDFQRSIVSPISCEEPVCKDRSKITKLGECEQCPDFQIPTEDRKGCERPKCDVRERILKNGACQICPNYERTFDDKLKCERPTCGDREKLMKDGTCEKCSAYEKTSDDGLSCVLPKCGDREKITPTGECEECAPFKKPDWSKLECEFPKCGDREKSMEDGSCEKCPDFQTVICENEDKCDRSKCREPVCGDRQIVKSNATCEECKPFTTTSIPQGFKDGDLLPEGMGGIEGQNTLELFKKFHVGARECVAPKCGDREKILPDGKCEKCEDFTVVGADKQTCEMPKCSFNEFVELDGVCAQCEPYTKVSSDRLGCEQPKCSDREVFTLTGSCKYCKPFEKPNDLQIECIQPVCGPREKVSAAGECVQCQEYTIASKGGRTCEQPKCGENEFTRKDGACQACDKFQVVSKDGHSCIKPDCVDRQFITKDGTCQQCPPYQNPTEDKMSCETVVCEDEKDSIGPDGKCHDYDETLESRHEQLTKEATACSQSVAQMNLKIQELMLQLQKEINSKEQIQNELLTEKQMSAQYRAERDLLTIKLEEKQEKLVATQLSYDTEAQAKLQLQEQLTNGAAMLEKCQTERSEILAERNNLKLAIVDTTEKLLIAQQSLTIYNEEKQKANDAIIEECLASLAQSEKQRISQRSTAALKYATLLGDFNDQKELTGVYEKKLLAIEQDKSNILGEMQKKATETQLQQHQKIQQLKAKHQECLIEKFECQNPDPVTTPTTTTTFLPTIDPSDPFSKFDMTQGKCRKKDKFSYTPSHVYNLLNTRYRINTEQGCAERCNADPSCKGFQYYQLDEGAYDNCNIWTDGEYQGNGSMSTKCYWKKPDEPATPTFTPSTQTSQILYGKDRCSNHDHQCIECDPTFEIAGCLKCELGWWLMAGVCYRTAENWGNGQF